MNTKAQISLEHTFAGNSSGFYNRFLYLDIGGNDYKYVIINYSTSKVDIYNLDYTPFQINITTALSLEQYDIAYISKNLFDCDDSTIEYGLMNDSSVNVYRLDGTLLFSRSDVVAPYCFGCNNGSTSVKPIINTPNGTKLILQDNNTHATFVYSLCGELPLSLDAWENGDSVTIFPVPTGEDGTLNFKINLPNYMTNNRIDVYNLNMQKLDTIEIIESNSTFSKKYNFAPGVYLYTLKSSGQIIKTGKFIIK